jgi:heme oxygenase (mycobilin-producing)
LLVINRFVTGADQEPAGQESFVARAHTALAVLAAQPGYRRGQLTRSVDEPANWCLVTEWDSVGAYRRALSAYEVKVRATPLLAESLPEPSAYEVLASADASGPVVATPSDVATRRSR